MPSNNDKYKQEELVLLAIELRDLHLKLKDAVHDPKVRQQTKIPTRKEFISASTVYTKAKDHAIRLCKARDKKEAKASGKSNGSKLRVVRVDAALSRFLRLKERALPEDMYPDTLVTSNFTNWVVANNLQNGKEVKLMSSAAGAEFIRLFGNDLKQPGSGPTIKNQDGTETLTSVLDSEGKQINPFNMNKHMAVFAKHYPQVPKSSGGTYKKGREVIDKDKFPQIYEIMQQEHALFTGQLGDSRKRYREAQDVLKKLTDKKSKAIDVGDRGITDAVKRAELDLKQSKQEYVKLLNTNRIPHTIPL